MTDDEWPFSRRKGGRAAARHGRPSPFGIRYSAFSYEHSGFPFIHHAEDEPSRRTFRVANGLARGGTVTRDDDALVQAGAMRVDGDLRWAFGFARSADRLADDQPPALQAR